MISITVSIAMIALLLAAILWSQIVESRYHEGQAKHWREQYDAEVLRRKREVDAADWWKPEGWRSEEET